MDGLTAGTHLDFFMKFWLGCLDSNQGMTVPKTVALPLGYTPIRVGQIDYPYARAAP